MFRKRDKLKRFLCFGGDSTLAISPPPNAATLQPSTTDTVTNVTAHASGLSIAPAPQTPPAIPAPQTPPAIPAPQTPPAIPAPQTPPAIPAPQTPPAIVQDDPNMITKAMEWWKDHQQGLLGALESALNIAEKATVVVPHAQAVIGAAAATVKTLRAMDENRTTIKEIADHIDKIIAELVRVNLPSSDTLPAAISPDAVARVEKFNKRLGEIKKSATGHSSTVRNFYQRFLDAERISKQLDGAWSDVSLAYHELNAATNLVTEAKVDGVHARVEDVHDRVGLVQGLVTDVHMNQATQKAEDLLDRLKPVMSAFHDAPGAAPACLKRTRTQLLDEISDWMADPSAKLVYWLTGVAGTGKTTIAQSVAYMAEERGCLAAAFLFSRTAGSGDRRRAAAVIPTVAYQLADRHHIFRDSICGAISSERDVGERHVAKQAKTLLLDALGGSRQPPSLPLVIVLDALDECDKENGREGGDLIPVLLHSLEKLPFCIKIFVTSRPEPSIKNMFSRADITSSTVGLALHRDIEESIVREDIGRYLRHEFGELAYKRSVPPPFPSDADFQTLVDRAGNLFIYVRTIVMYVSSEVEDPVDQLADVLHVDESRVSKQFADLDALYTQILIKASDIVGHDVAAQRQLRDVLGSLALVQENLPVAALAAVAGVEERQCKMILRCLSSVLLYEHTSQEPVRLIHPSFPDFLTHDDRCTDARYFVDGAQHHSLLALRCLQIMNADLRRNICNLQNPFLPNSDIPDLDQRLDRNASAQLRYACKYWYVHVQSAGCFHPDLITALDAFCTKHLLHWLELLSLITQVPAALRDLPLLLSHVESFDEMRDGRTHSLLTDVERLLLAYRIPIIQGALHVYYSALATMPSCLLLDETILHDGYGIPLLVTKRVPGWGVRKTILDVLGGLRHMAYSPNGKLVASVSTLYANHGSSGVIRVWDLATGTALHTMFSPQTEADRYNSNWSVAFSPNSQWIVSGSTDCTVQLWDVVTGSLHRVMTGHTDVVTFVAFSPDGTIIGSSSYDGTLRIWDVGTGDERQVMTGHISRVISLAFAPNGQTVVSASSDGTLRVWDVLTGTQLHVMDGDGESLSSVAFSPDGAIIASGSWSGSGIQLWSATNSTRQHALEGHEYVLSFAFSPDSRSIVSSDKTRLVRIWDVTTGIEKRSFRVTVNEVRTVAYSPDGKSIAVGCCPVGLETSTIRIWDANTSAAAPPTAEAHHADTHCMAFSPDGLLVASGSHDGTVRIWEALTGTERHVMEVGESVYSITFSPDNRTIAWGQLNGIVQLWDTASESKQPFMMGQHAERVGCVAFSLDSKCLLSYSWQDGTARVWDAGTGAQQHILTHPFDDNTNQRRDLAFSVDGKAITMLEDYESDAVMGFWDLTAAQPEYTESTSPHTRTPAITHTSKQHRFGGHSSGWIRHGTGWEKPTHVCWLPQERRGGSFACSGTKVCFDGEDGMITILDFAPVDVLPQIV